MLANQQANVTNLLYLFPYMMLILGVIGIITTIYSRIQSKKDIPNYIKQIEDLPDGILDKEVAIKHLNDELRRKF